MEIKRRGFLGLLTSLTASAVVGLPTFSAAVPQAVEPLHLPGGPMFSSDGKAMFIEAEKGVYVYELNMPWNISTSWYVGMVADS